MPHLVTKCLERWISETNFKFHPPPSEDYYFPGERALEAGTAAKHGTFLKWRSLWLLLCYYVVSIRHWSLFFYFKTNLCVQPHQTFDSVYLTSLISAQALRSIQTFTTVLAAALERILEHQCFKLIASVGAQKVRLVGMSLGWQVCGQKCNLNHLHAQTWTSSSCESADACIRFLQVWVDFSHPAL